MGERVVTRPLDISDHTMQVNRGDTIFKDLWCWGFYSSGVWIPNAENEFFHSEQQWWAIGEELKLNWTTKRKWHGPIGLLSTQAQVKVWCQRETKATGTWGLGVKKGFGYCKEPNVGKARAQLGRAILHHISGWNRCISPWRSRGKCCTMPLECK